ncbi:MAG TPA: glucokinase [Gammaproteobacteria bacterium]|nr:glucokinase [Gammaproteobacteria bacterium]
MDLIADIGATNTRCALLDDNGQEFAPVVFQNAESTGVAAVLNAYLGQRRASDRPKRAALAVAAPIVGDHVQMINIDWQFSRAELTEQLGLTRLLIVNDFAAIAWALPHLRPPDLRKLGGGTAAPQSTLATLGPGSGLGVSALVPANDTWSVISGEGGHATLAGVTEEEAAVVELIRKRTGQCVLESALSGPGLVNLYVALAQLAGRGEPTVTPTDVTSLARQGEPLARKTRAMFFAMLGTVAGDLALTLGARGGVYIAGGIIPQLLDEFVKSSFRERFEARAGYEAYMQAIPTYVITAALPAFRGLRQLLGFR